MTFGIWGAREPFGGPAGEAGQRRVEAMVPSAFAVGSEAIRARQRGPARAAFARQVAMYLSRTHLGLSLTATGAFFGRDRTTAAHACRVVEQKRDDPHIDAIVDVLERAIEVWPELAAVKRWDR
jgi:chromosomal replication initiation ATPase DnaA